VSSHYITIQVGVIVSRKHIYECFKRALEEMGDEVVLMQHSNYLVSKRRSDNIIIDNVNQVLSCEISTYIRHREGNHKLDTMFGLHLSQAPNDMIGVRFLFDTDISGINNRDVSTSYINRITNFTNNMTRSLGLFNEFVEGGNERKFQVNHGMPITNPYNIKAEMILGNLTTAAVSAPVYVVLNWLNEFSV
jgi:hypothetical protein